MLPLLDQPKGLIRCLFFWPESLHIKQNERDAYVLGISTIIKLGSFSLKILMSNLITNWMKRLFVRMNIIFFQAVSFSYWFAFKEQVLSLNVGKECYGSLRVVFCSFRINCLSCFLHIKSPILEFSVFFFCKVLIFYIRSLYFSIFGLIFRILMKNQV